MASELEMKLATDADTLATLSTLTLQGEWQSGPWQQQQLVTRYYDTDDLDLQERGISLRLRSDGQRLVQTIKSAGVVLGGLHQRDEWNVVVQGTHLDIAHLPETEWTPWLAALWRNQELHEIFRSDFIRRKCVLTHSSGTRIELALDAGAVVASAGGEQAPLCEVELELLSGDSAPLFSLARQLAQTYALHPDGRSKAQRGYHLLHHPAIADVRLQPISIADNASAWQVFVDGVRAAWLHWQRYENEFRTRPDVPSAEQMRRALSLFRHALTCYHQLNLPIPVRTWRRMLSKLLRAFAWADRAREQLAADALVHRLEGETYLPCQKELADLLPDVRSFDEGIKNAQHLLNSREYCLFTLDVAAFLHAPGDAPNILNESVEERATALIVRQWESLQTVWENAPATPDIGFYRGQHRFLQRAVWSALLFGDLFEQRKQNPLINPCRDLLAGIQDANTLDQLDRMARDLSSDDYRGFTGWLMAQRETLWQAMTMTRLHALRAEPETLES